MSESRQPILKKVRISHFMSIEEAEINLSPLTIFIGPNNSGKSNVFWALRWMSNLMCNPAISAWRSSPGDNISRYFYNFDTNRNISFGCFYDVEGHEIEYQVELNYEGKKQEKLLIDGNNSTESLNVSTTQELMPSNIRLNSFLQKYIKNQNYLRYFSLIPQHIAMPNNITENPEITETGGNVAAVLDWIWGQDRTKFSQIETELIQCIPEIENIILKNVGTGQKQLGIKEKNCNKPFVAQAVSEGVLLFITLLTIIHQLNPPKIICLEEPEQHIHPKRLRNVLDYLTDLAYHVPEPIQILISTHSPYLLDYFKDRQDEVVIVDKKDGKTIFTPLCAHREILTKESPLGDIWFSGLIGGVPKP